MLIKKLKHQLAGMHRHRFGSRSEALDQLALTLEDEEIAASAQEAAPVDADMGYGLNEIEGKHHSMFAEPDFAASSEYKEFWAAPGRGEYQASDYKRLSKDNKEVWAPYNSIFNRDGEPFKVVKFAADITRQREGAEENAKAARLVQMVDDMPLNMVMCDAENLEITCANKGCFNTLKTLQDLLPVQADTLVGQCIDIFHKDPSHQRQTLADPNNLAHKA